MTRELAKLEAWVDARLWAGVSKVEREILINYKIALDKIRITLTKTYDKYAAGGVLTNAEMTKYNRLKSLHDQLTGIMGETLSKNGKKVEKLAAVQYEQSYFMHGWAIDQASGVALRWGLLNEAAVKAAVENELEKIAITKLKSDGLIGIRRAVTQGIVRGQSYTAIAKEVKKYIEKNAMECVRITQTEAHRAQVLGQIENYAKAEDLGVELTRKWEAMLDDRTRPSHAEMDGVEADENGLFDTSWGTVNGPGLEGPPEEVINCRCRVVGEIDGYGPKIRYARDQGLIPYKTFRDWADDTGLKKNIYGQVY